jgi:uncharacterized protein DUF3850
MSSPPAAPVRGVHILKSLHRSFWATWSGDKRHEVRVFDRAYVVNDSVILLEYSPAPLMNPETGKPWPIGPTGWWGPRVIVGTITNLTGPEQFGLPHHLCCFTVGNLSCLTSDLQAHDYTRPPRPSLAAVGLLPPHLVEAWSSYKPRTLGVPPAPAASSARAPAKKPKTKGRRNAARAATR